MQALVNNENFTEISDCIDLTTCINFDHSSRGIVADSLKATTLQAVIGAVFKDSDLNTVESVLANLGLSMTLDDTVMIQKTSPPHR